MPAESWSADEDQRLLQLIRETGLRQREIAQKLGRTEAAVNSRLSILRKRAADGEYNGNDRSLLFRCLEEAPCGEGTGKARVVLSLARRNGRRRVDSK
jgi:hypothetical protein